MTAKMYEIDKEVASIRVARWPYYYYRGDPKPARGAINTSGRGGPYLDENCVLVVTEGRQDFYRGGREIPIFSDPTKS